MVSAVSEVGVPTAGGTASRSVALGPAPRVAHGLFAAWLVVGTLARRELTRFFRQRNRVIGALGQPLVFWLVFGLGLGPSFSAPGGAGGGDYLTFLFPGMLALVMLSTAIFTSISIIEDRREGFLQAVLVAPAPRWSMVLGKLLGGTSIAVLQGAAFVAVGAALALPIAWARLPAFFALAGVVALALSALGFVLAWRTDSVQGFHAVMSVLLMPMWFLSGAFFPPAGWLKWIMLANPLSYGVAGLRALLYDAPGGAADGDVWRTAGLAAAVSLALAAVLFAVACRVAETRTTGDLL